MIGGEGDENGEENKREVWFGKQNRKEDEVCSKEMKTKLNKEDGENNDEKIKEEF